MFYSFIKEEGTERGVPSLLWCLKTLLCKTQQLALLQPSYKHEGKAKTITEELPMY